MHKLVVALLGLAILTSGAPATASGQERPDPAALAAAQREAMSKLAFMDGMWKGSAWMIMPSGEKHSFTQTERVGPFLDGSIKAIEGRGYEADGSIAFNAFAIISFDPASQNYSMRSYAQGHAGDFVLKPTADGFQWEIPAGPMTIRYTAVISGDSWKEVGDRILPKQEPIRFMEMTLTRIGDTDWPVAGAVDLD